MVLSAKLRSAYDRILTGLRRIDRMSDKVVNPVRDAVVDHVFMPPFEAWMRWYERRNPAPKSYWLAKRNKIVELPTVKAKEMFFELLSKGDAYWVVEEESNDPSLDVLPHEVRSLLSRYREINGDGLQLTRDAMANEPPEPGCVWIGDEDGGHEMVLVKYHEEPIYFWDGLNQDPNDPLGPPEYPSVYHWLICALYEDLIPDAASDKEILALGDKRNPRDWQARFLCIGERCRSDTDCQQREQC